MGAPRLPAGTSARPPKGARARLIAAGGLILLALLLVAVPWLRGLALGLWILGNFGLFWTLVGYGLFHLRSITPAAGVSGGWSLGLAAVLSVGSFSYLETFVGEYFGFKVPAGLVFLGVVASFVVLLPVLMIGGFAGTAAGAWLGPRGEPAARARVGAVTWYLVSTLLTLGALLPPTDSGGLTPALLLGAPILTVAAVRGLARAGVEPGQLAAWVLHFLSGRLIWRYEKGAKRYRLDFRGAVLGVLAGLFALGVGASEVLVPVQSLVLVSLIRARNEPVVGEANLVQIASQDARRERRGMVLLNFDPETRRAALSTRSEVEVQIEAIRRLREWGAGTIVLPAPVVVVPEMQHFAAEGPLPQETDVERNLRDLPKLERLLRDSRNVVLGVPEQQEAFVRGDFSLLGRARPARPAEVQRLAGAAPAFGQSGVAFVGAARLPAIPTTWKGEPPLAVVTAASIRGTGAQLTREAGGRVRFLGRVFQEIAPGRVLVDFLAPSPGAEFPTVTYGELQRNEPIYNAEAGKPPAWVPPKEFFRGKTVFLDSLYPITRDTPIGQMPLQEVVASAVATLLTETSLRSFGGPAFWLWTLFLAWWTGVLCGRKNPVAAGWRALALIALIFGLTFWAFLLQRTWADPVVPSLAVLGSFLLATQLTFELERGERERQRALFRRFAAPELVEQMLDDPDFVARAGGQRRQVCVVFADVRNFTRFAERSTPEEVIEITNRYLGAMTDVVMGLGGILDKYTGDGLMAFFMETGDGAPGASQAMNVRAVRAAIEMQQAVARISSELLTEGRSPLGVGIGLHYGEAVVGLVGNASRRLDYTALGHTVVVSQRLQSIAGGGEVVISETVYRTVHGLFRVEPGEPVQVKGLSEPVRPYRVATPAQGVIPPVETSHTT